MLIKRHRVNVLSVWLPAHFSILISRNFHDVNVFWYPRDNYKSDDILTLGYGIQTLSLYFLVLKMPQSTEDGKDTSGRKEPFTLQMFCLFGFLLIFSILISRKFHDVNVFWYHRDKLLV